jgi:hypothetical protein
MLAFEDFEEITLSGLTIKGERIENRKIRVCGPGAYAVLEAFAFNNRGENKDACDLYYVIRTAPVRMKWPSGSFRSVPMKIPRMLSKF